LILPQSAETSQRLLFFVLGRLALYQAQFLSRQRPSVGIRLGKAGKPALILIEQQPVLMSSSECFQPVASFFFGA
jgi:hypothetical protein